MALLNLALVAIGRGEPIAASLVLLEALDIAEAIGSQLAGANVMAITAGVAALREDWADAAWFHAAATAQMRLTGQRPDPADDAVLAPLAARTRGATNAPTFEASASSGAAASYEQSLGAAREWLVSR